MASKSSLKPIKHYSHVGGPNPWKTQIVFRELGLPFEDEFVEFSNIKAEPFISVNPNGRVPAITDPNNSDPSFTLWESGAIIQYLVEKYDTDHKISFPAGSAEKYHADQWLFFQVSGQGPYMGQAAWFMRFHQEKLPSAIERYQKETMRIVGVIDAWLKKTGQQYLVGYKASYADLSFVPWGANVAMLMGKDVFADGEYSAYKEWIERLQARPAVKEAFEQKASMAEKH